MHLLDLRSKSLRSNIINQSALGMTESLFTSATTVHYNEDTSPYCLISGYFILRSILSLFVCGPEMKDSHYSVDDLHLGTIV